MSILDSHSNPGQGSMKFTVQEGDQFIGRFSLESAPNSFLAGLMREADEYGDAQAEDEQGCLVTVSADEG